MGAQEVKIVHGETGDEAYVSEEAADAYGELGWTRADDGSSESEKAPAKKTTKEG
jgi:hypothetical protein